MYNRIIKNEIKRKYDEVFKIIGEKVGLRKLTYETYLGLNENDTRRKAVNRVLEKTLRLRDDADVCECIDIINDDVKSEDIIDDKIDSFFKLGEKMYPKEEEQEEIAAPDSLFEAHNEEEQEEIVTPDRLFEVHNEEEQDEMENENNNTDNNEKKKNSLLKDIGITSGNAVLNFVRWTSIGIGTIVLVGHILTPGGIGITVGTIAVPAVIAASTFVIPYVAKRWDKIVAKFSKKERQNVDNVNHSDEMTNNINNEISNERTLTSTDSQQFELNFEDEMEEPFYSDEAEEYDEEMPEDEIENSDYPEDYDDEEPLAEVEDEEVPETPSQEEAEDAALPEPIYNNGRDIAEESDEEIPEDETENSDYPEDYDDEEPLTGFEDEEVPETPSQEEVEDAAMPESINENGEANRLSSNRRQRTIYEAEQTIMEINKKIEGYEQTINKINQRLKEIQDNKYGYPNQKHVDAHNVTKPKREYNELRNKKAKVLKEMKKYQDVVHDLSEKIDNIRDTEVPVVTEIVTKHQVPINNWETKEIYIVNEPDSRIKESIDYTDKFENKRKK